MLINKIINILFYIFDNRYSRQMKILFTTVFILVFGFLYSQTSEQVYFSGKVMDYKKKTLPFVNIVIRNKHKGTISDEKGYFAFFVNKTDTIIFSSIGYKKSRYIIPDTLTKNYLSLNIFLEQDTIKLRQTDIFPWQNYEEFKQAFVHMKIPDDDYDRADKNFALMQRQLVAYDESDYPAAPGVGYHIYMNQYYDKLYYNGQTQSIKLLDPIAWAKFFKALKNGDFKQDKDDD